MNVYKVKAVYTNTFRTTVHWVLTTSEEEAVMIAARHKIAMPIGSQYAEDWYIVSRDKFDPEKDYGQAKVWAEVEGGLTGYATPFSIHGGDWLK